MKLYIIIAQIIGIFAMLFNIFSYQQKTSKGAIGFQLCGGILFSVNFFMLGATVGGIMNVIAAIRAVIFINKEKSHADHIGWLIGFIAIYILTYILTFTLFGKAFTPFNAIIEVLPIIGMTALTFGFRMSSAKAIRSFGLISSPCWLVYNIVNFSIGAIICEVISLFSIGIGFLRHDRNP